MRRPFLTIQGIIFIFLAGLFSLLSFFFDQQVIQKEGDVRDVELEILATENNIFQYDLNHELFNGITERAVLRLNEYHMNSTLDYKFILNLNLDVENKNEWLGVEMDRLGEDVSYNFGTRLYNISYYNGALKDQIQNFVWSAEENLDESLKDRWSAIYEDEDDFYEEYMEKIDNNALLSVDDANYMFKAYYNELYELEEIFNLAMDLSEEFLSKSDEFEELLNKGRSKLKQEKISKNYFILVSILSQILSLLFLLLLFRTIILNVSNLEND